MSGEHGTETAKEQRVSSREEKFRHIYVERKVLGLERTEHILRHFPEAEVIVIRHYKDVFNRRRQNPELQHRNQNLIIAAKEGRLVYPGAPVCQSFGNEHFFYTSCIMNCVYDCEYCYLKGMYPSGNLVIFVNLEDIFAEVRALLARFPVYLCVSYDTDLMAVDGLTGYVEEWAEFVRDNPGLSIEVRTKSPRLCTEMLRKTGSGDGRLIYAATLSPDEVIRAYEHGTGTLDGRIRAARSFMDAGFPVRLCFDPMIYMPDWENIYGRMVRYASEHIDFTRVRDFSVGSFRISETYLKPMRRALPGAAVVQYPFELTDGYYHYPAVLADRMEKLLEREIRLRAGNAAIFRWEE